MRESFPHRPSSSEREQACDFWAHNTKGCSRATQLNYRGARSGEPIRRAWARYLSGPGRLGGQKSRPLKARSKLCKIAAPSRPPPPQAQCGRRAPLCASDRAWQASCARPSGSFALKGGPLATARRLNEMAEASCECGPLAGQVKTLAVDGGWRADCFARRTDHDERAARQPGRAEPSRSGPFEMRK